MIFSVQIVIKCDGDADDGGGVEYPHAIGVGIRNSWPFFDKEAILLLIDFPLCSTTQVQ